MTTSTASLEQKSQIPAPVLNRIEVQLPEDPFLLAKFEEFYMEVARLKSALAGLPAGAASSTYSSRQIQQLLLKLLRKQKADVERAETLLGVEMYRQAQHVMACLADEIFSARFRSNGGAWQSLEAELFGSQAGLAPGGSCLQKLDGLLRQDDPVYRELASVYLYALALRGAGYRDTEQYLAPLYKVIAPGPDTSGNLTLLFPESYAHTFNENKTAFLPSPKKWLLILIFILLGWIAVSSVLWVQLTSPVERQLHEIETELQP